MDTLSELPQGTLTTLQKYTAHKIKEWGFEDETLHERLILLTEEIGELAKACRKASNMNVDKARPVEHAPGEEVADVLMVLLAVAIKLGIDVEKEFREKEAKANKRTYERAQ